MDLSGLFLRTFSHPIDEQNRFRILAEWRYLALRLPTDKTDRIDTVSAVGAVSHHGYLRGSGIAQNTDTHLILLIAGSYWLEDSDQCLATPAEALQILMEHGFSEQQTLKGNYSFILLDTLKCRIVAESDPFGVIPLYYAVTDSGFVIGTELKFLRSALRPQLNREAVAEYLTIGYLVSDLTLLDGVRRLSPGSRLSVEGSEVRISSFPLLPFPRNKEPDDTFYDELDDSFERAIGRYSVDTSRFSVSLSGGVDSRTALVAAVKQGFDVEAWTAGEPGSLECRVAQDFCRRVDIPIQVHVNQGDRLPSWFDQAVWTTEARCPPGHLHFFDALFAGHYRSAPQLHGLIGDVVAGGDYDFDGVVPSDPSALTHFCRGFMQSILYWPRSSWQDLGFEGWIAPKRVYDLVGSTILSRCPQDDPYSTYLWSRYQFRAFGFIVPCLMSQVTPWTDVITPFMDPAFFAKCAQIATGSILDRRTQIGWAVRRYPTLSLAPRVKDGVLIPFSGADPGDYGRGIRRLDRIRKLRYLICRLSSGQINLSHRETYPFYGAWFRKFPSVRRFFEERLLSPASLDRGLWRREGVIRLLHDLRVGRNVWDGLATLLLLETFARLFVDGSLVPSTTSLRLPEHS